MPIHDWTRVEAGIFHHFQHEWISAISRSLNQSLYGTDYYALAEQITGNMGPDVVTLQRPIPAPKEHKAARNHRNGCVALAEHPPKVQFRITKPPTRRKPSRSGTLASIKSWPCWKLFLPATSPAAAR